MTLADRHRPFSSHHHHHHLYSLRHGSSSDEVGITGYYDPGQLWRARSYTAMYTVLYRSPDGQTDVMLVATAPHAAITARVTCPLHDHFIRPIIGSLGLLGLYRMANIDYELYQRL